MCLWCFKSLKTCGFLLLFLSRNEWYRKQTHSIENMVVVQSGSNFSALTKKIDQLLHNGYHMSKFRISRFAAATIKTKRNKKISLCSGSFHRAIILYCWNMKDIFLDIHENVALLILPYLSLSFHSYSSTLRHSTAKQKLFAKTYND